jgi:putative membrane protein
MFRDYLGLFIRGFIIGCTDIVPAISGGTMALILGIYEELIVSLKAMFNREAIRLALRFKIKQAMDLVPWQFLFAVAVGILMAVFSMSFFLEWMLHHYPSLLWGLFFGLVAAATLIVRKKVGHWGVSQFVGVAVGAVFAFVLVGLVPAETPNTWWFWFLSGVIAVCAMILPGPAGSFVLVLLGKYEQLLAAVTNMRIGILLLVIAGAGTGMLCFAQVLNWLLKNAHDTTVAVLMGLMIGALRKLWPWGLLAQATYHEYGALSLASPWHIVWPALLIGLGLVLVLMLDRYAPKKPETEH